MTSEKRIVIVYGNCHTSIIRSYLILCKEFNESYELHPIEYIQNIKSPSYFYENTDIRNCDVFIHQSIRKGNRYGEEYSSENIIKLLKSSCKVISIPNLYQLPVCFFPQFVKGNEFKDSYLTVFFRDKIIDELYSKGANWKKIYDVYQDPSVFDAYDFEEAFNNFIEKVKLRELEWDIKVTDFILENYKKTILFHDPNHPTNYLLGYIAIELLKKLGITNPTINNIQNIQELDSFEIPAYESTYKNFLVYVPKRNIYRKTGRKVIRGKMDLKAYIKQYISMEWQNKSLSKYLRIKSFCKYTCYRVIDFILHVIQKLMKTFFRKKIF